MSRIFEVAEEKLSHLLDTVLKAGGLAVHGAVTALISSLKVKEECVAPVSPVSPETPEATCDGSPEDLQK